MKSWFIYHHTFESTGVTVLRLRQPLRWWRRWQFKRYLKRSGVGDPTRSPVLYGADDPEAVRLFERMDYYDSYGSLRG